MTKVVAVYDDNYKVVVQNGGTITLDPTGGEADRSGQVVIKGDLEIEGETTTVESETLTVKDNMIFLNVNDSLGAGIPASLDYRSGIQIDRGTLPSARFIFDERIGWTLGGSSGLGTFIIETGDINDESTGDYIPLALAGIKGAGPNGKLYIDTDNSVISVTNTNDYEEEIWNYVAGVITDEGSGVVIDDDHVPNAKAIVDYVDYFFVSEFQDKIAENDTSVETKDFDTTGSESVVEVTVNGELSAKFFDNRIETQGLKFQDNIISTQNINEDLVLKAPGTGSVQVDDVFEIIKGPGLYDDDITSQPSTPSQGIKLYTDTQGTGKVGLYYVNSSSTRDELISKNRSLLFSMLF